jgi:hypothetical protein
LLLVLPLLLVPTWHPVTRVPEALEAVSYLFAHGTIHGPV